MGNNPWELRIGLGSQVESLKNGGPLRKLKSNPGLGNLGNNNKKNKMLEPGIYRDRVNAIGEF